MLEELLIFFLDIDRNGMEMVDLKTLMRCRVFVLNFVLMIGVVFRFMRFMMFMVLIMVVNNSTKCNANTQRRKNLYETNRKTSSISISLKTKPRKANEFLDNIFCYLQTPSTFSLDIFEEIYFLKQLNSNMLRSAVECSFKTNC